MLEELLKRLRGSRKSISPYQDLRYSDTPGRADPIQQKFDMGGAWNTAQENTEADHESVNFLMQLAKKYAKTPEEQQQLFNQLMGMDLNSILNGNMQMRQNMMTKPRAM